MSYNWQDPNWPTFTYEQNILNDLLYRYVQNTGQLVGMLQGLDSISTQEILLDHMVFEAQNTSKIEGELFDDHDIRSSICKQMHPDVHLPKIHDVRAEGIAKLILQLHTIEAQDLTQELILSWHKLLFEHPFYAHLQRGAWRTTLEPMQIISGPIGHEKIYFEAPPSHSLTKEMKQFIEWVNAPQIKALPSPVRAGIAHIYFESIHPFEDGNGRIGRAICEFILAKEARLFSLSKAIVETQKQYYIELHRASCSLEIISWLVYFLNMLLLAQKEAMGDIQFVLQKSLFWKKYESQLNARQTRVIQRMLQERAKGFEGGINARKYMNITQCSKATATRDLTELLAMQCLKKLSFEGRSIAYELAL